MFLKKIFCLFLYLSEIFVILQSDLKISYEEIFIFAQHFQTLSISNSRIYD